ncbi:hypothetical protein O0L34_g11044 [Tuta absoluta]|nr:hypothetical protein O0L34_g11044 [Tuta absoluta]
MAVLCSQFTNNGYTSTLRYTPTKDKHFGTVQCTASNTVGKQEAPCVYRVVSAGRPSALQNCTIVNHSAALLLVDCVEGFDGGLPQVFFMEVLELPSMLVKANVTANHTPVFEVHGLDRGSSYALNLYAVNSKGKSDRVILYTVALRSPDKYIGSTTPLPLSPMLVSLLAVAALLCTGVCGVITALYRRHVARQHTDKHPPSANALYLERSMESLAKEHSNTYCGSPKLDYSQYELKVDPCGDAESDPDLIPCLHDKRPEFARILSADDRGNEVHRIFSEHSLNFPPSVSVQSISVVNRGVTARSADITAAQTPRSVDFAAQPLRSADLAAQTQRSVDFAAQPLRSADLAAQTQRSVDFAAQPLRSADLAAQTPRQEVVTASRRVRESCI